MINTPSHHIYTAIIYYTYISFQTYYTIHPYHISSHLYPTTQPYSISIPSITRNIQTLTITPIPITTITSHIIILNKITRYSNPLTHNPHHITHFNHHSLITIHQTQRRKATKRSADYKDDRGLV